MVKTKNGIGVWPCYTFSYRVDNNRKPIGEYKTWIPVDEGYFILLSRKYYYARTLDNPGMDVFARFYTDVNDVVISYDPDQYKPVGHNILEPISPDYL